MNNKNNIVLTGKNSINYANKKIVKNNLNDMQIELDQNEDYRQVIINK